MEHLALELIDTRQAWQLRHVEHAASKRHESRTAVVAAIGGDPPTLDTFIPTQRCDLRVAPRFAADVDFSGTRAAVLLDFPAVAEILRRHAACFFWLRQIAILHVVSLYARLSLQV